MEWNTNVDDRLNRLGFAPCDGISPEHRAEIAAVYGKDLTSLYTAEDIVSRVLHAGQDDEVTQYASTDGWIISCPLQGQPAESSGRDFDLWLSYAVPA